MNASDYPHTKHRQRQSTTLSNTTEKSISNWPLTSRKYMLHFPFFQVAARRVHLPDHLPPALQHELHLLGKSSCLARHHGKALSQEDPQDGLYHLLCSFTTTADCENRWVLEGIGWRTSSSRSSCPTLWQRPLMRLQRCMRNIGLGISFSWGHICCFNRNVADTALMKSEQSKGN